MQTFLPFAVLSLAVFLFHIVPAAYALVATGSVASLMVQPQRTLESWLYLFALRIYRYDAEADILNPSLDESVRCANVRSRAWISIAYSVVFGGFVVFMFVRGGIFQNAQLR